MISPQQSLPATAGAGGPGRAGRGELERFGYRQELRRSLGFTDLVAYGLIYMIPTAPFGIFGSVFSGSGGMVALTYLIGTVVMMFTAASYGQMAKAFPVAGSVYTYAGRGIVPAVGFLTGWAMLLDYVLLPSVGYLIAGLGIHAAVPAVPVWAGIAGLVVLNTVINYFGIRITALVTRAMVVAEMVVLVIFVVVGVVALLHGKGRGFSLDPLYNPSTFSRPLLFGATSVAVLSFLGFDAISMLAEENRGTSRLIGRSMAAALALAGLLFIAQTWVAALLVEHPAKLIHDGDPGGSAFYDAARLAGGGWLTALTAATTVMAFGIGATVVSQVATSRLLYAMARDRQLPRFLAKVSPKRMVPTNAILLCALVSLVMGVVMSLRSNGLNELTSMINFGAMTAFLALHVSVVWHYLVRRRSRNYIQHLLLPFVGFGLLVFVVVNANVAAQAVGISWLVLGAVVMIVLYAMGRRPALSGLSTTEGTGAPLDAG